MFNYFLVFILTALIQTHHCCSFVFCVCAQALIEMVDWRDADIMVKYYYSNPLRIQGKSVKVAMSHITSLR